MSVITTIRQKLSRKEQEQRHQELEEYNDLVVAIADGHEPSVEEVERFCPAGAAERPKLLCPKNPEHRRVRIVKTEGNSQSCICEDCLTEFKREYDPDAAPITGRTVEDLERDVELLKQRRQWAADLQRLPDLEQSEGKLRAKLEKARAKARKAIAEQQKVADEVAPELQTIEQQKRDAERAREKLQSSCRDARIAEEYNGLDKQRRQLAERKQHLRRDLWGYSPVGTVKDPVHGSTGDKLLSLDRKIDNRAANRQHPDRKNLGKYKRQLDDFKRREFDPLVREYHSLSEQLEQIEARIEELQQKMLEP